MFGKKKGQATIEYLVLLAVAIIIALVIFAFMGWIPGFAGSLKERQVKLYWASQFPLQIRDYQYLNNGTLKLQIQNVGDAKVNVTQIHIGSYPQPMNLSVPGNGSNTLLTSGETKVFETSISTCTASGAYELDNITIYYDVVGGIQNMSQKGDRPLVGTCQ